ncbi:beta-lactamase family protein [Pseudidiomarina sp. 1APR75-33.1]|uniref:serine hydrolase domain-containing protein n=1 Tax=Pseudidiomarina terrestris TaxID=2820060 RepID=UPI00264C3669|nr:serine hydrolase domain-containing protein [Pseudidiomarina sp. 1APR75-33.1]MDN7125951.1 beta-lactamase family protein [Pseudidiomarina sp. 1APR75-33.1]
MQVRHTKGGRRGFAALPAALCSLLLLAGTMSMPAQAQEDDPAAAVTTESTAMLDVEQQPALPGLGAYIDGTIEAQMALEDIQSVTVSVVKDGELLFAKGYGMQDISEGIPVSPETSLFRIGSTSKLFTWLSVMQLVEQGKLDLDTNVNEYLDFDIPATYEEPITLSHILSHTAGFEDGGLGYLIQYYPNKGPELAEAMAKYIPARVNPPGEVSSYSNYATALAGLIVQNVSGVPFNDYVEQNIFQPLGMKYASFDEPLPPELEPFMTRGYKRELGVWEKQPFEMINSFGPAGAVSASAVAMAKFMQANLNNGELNGNRILSEETMKQAHSLLFTADERVNGMAHGFYEKDYNGYRVVGHGGDTMQFHTDMAVDKENNLGIFVSYMTTVSNAARNNFVGQIYDHFYPRDVEPVEPPADFADRAGKYAGKWTFWRRNVSTIEKMFGLMSNGIDVIPTEENTLLVTGPFAVRQFVEVGENLFRQVDGDEQIVFTSRSGEGLDTFYFESLPFMAMQRMPTFETSLFKYLLPGLALLLFLHSVVSWFYKRKDYKTRPAASKALTYNTLWMSIVHLAFVVLLAVVILGFADSLYSGIPFLLKAALVLPLVAIVLTVIALIGYVKRLTSGDESFSVGRRIYYALLVLSGIYMCYFYYYWNMLGWDYFS